MPVTSLRERNWAKIAEWCGLALVIAFFVQRLLYRFIFWNDSTSYVGAAENLVKHGTLFVYLNWPSWTMQPGTELFADFAPGYPLYLAFFIFLFKDLMLSVAIAQSVALAAMFLAVYRVTALLGMQPLLRLAALCFLGAFQPHRDSLQSLLTEPLFLALCFGVLMSALEILQRGESTRRWAVACLFVFLASGVRWNGFASVALLALPLWKYRAHFWTKAAAILASGVLPISLWFLRNKIQLDQVSTFYTKPQLFLDRLATPFVASVKWWGSGSVLVALGVLAFSFGPLAVSQIRRNRDLTPYLTVVLGWIAHFLIIYALSLVTGGMTPVDDRYLMPTYFLFAVALFYSLNSLLETYRLEKLSVAAVAALAILFLPKAVTLLKAQKLEWIGAWTIPPEREMWAELKTRDFFQSATHFYTDTRPIHQMFAGIPQRIVRDSVINDTPDEISSLWNIPNSPFFVISKGSRLHELFETKIEKEVPGLKKEARDGYVIYHR